LLIKKNWNKFSKTGMNFPEQAFWNEIFLLFFYSSSAVMMVQLQRQWW